MGADDCNDFYQGEYSKSFPHSLLFTVLKWEWVWGDVSSPAPAIIILVPAVNLILQPTCTVSYTFLMGNVIRFVRKVVESDLSATEICIALRKHLGL